MLTEHQLTPAMPPPIPCVILQLSFLSSYVTPHSATALCLTLRQAGTHSTLHAQHQSLLIRLPTAGNQAVPSNLTAPQQNATKLSPSDLTAQRRTAHLGAYTSAFTTASRSPSFNVFTTTFVLELTAEPSSTLVKKLVGWLMWLYVTCTPLKQPLLLL